MGREGQWHQESSVTRMMMPLKLFWRMKYRNCVKGGKARCIEIKSHVSEWKRGGGEVEK
jgi:hypothetical protein